MHDLIDLVTLEYYQTRKIKHNWRVLLDGNHIGDMHDCDGIGGQLGSFTDTRLFDEVSDLVAKELELMKDQSRFDKVLQLESILGDVGEVQNIQDETIYVDMGNHTFKFDFDDNGVLIDIRKE